MPSFDGGHYFLTVLAPIEDRLVEHDGMKSSAIHMVRSALATLPTARQTEATEWLRLGSPFARAKRTHFARFVVIDDVVYNGRNPMNALLMALRKVNPVLAQPHDRLSTPYLLFAADFDARSAEPAEVRSYLAELWGTMQAELTQIFQYCVGFGAVKDAGGFADYVMACEIDTTMPFNDYWIDPPPFASLKTTLLTVVGGVVLVALAAIILLHSDVGWPWHAAIPFGLVLFAALLFIPYQLVIRNGRVPFPTAPDSDLRSVLKALYLQQKFVRLAIAAQGLEDAEIHRLFGAFLAEHRPGDLDAPTQEPGIIRAA
ncbi:MAG TPA: hypothetical protein VM689_19170 [Aliidongia sp.]|nr:hypothetical protein [Aliidongia sp.]